MPPTAPSANQESGTSFFEESFQANGEAPIKVGTGPQSPTQGSPLTPGRGRRHPSGQPALPKIPRNSLKGGNPVVVKNVKHSHHDSARSKSHSPVRPGGATQTTATTDDNTLYSQSTDGEGSRWNRRASAGGDCSTVGTNDEEFEDEFDDASTYKRRRSESRAAIHKMAMKLLNATDNDEVVMKQKGRRDKPPRSRQRKLSPASQGNRRRQAEEINFNNSQTMNSEQAVPDPDQDTVDVSLQAQEQAVAIAKKMSRKPHAQSDDGTIASGRSLRSKSSHRSRDHLDPELEFLHTSVLEDAALENKSLYMEDDESLGSEYNPSLYEKYCSGMGACCLCGILLALWGGLIPYLIVKNIDGTAAPEVILTAPPTDNNMIPWTTAPTQSPGSRKPTSPPTRISDNQELLDLLGSGSEPSEDAAMVNTTEVTETIISVTLAPTSEEEEIDVMETAPPTLTPTATQTSATATPTTIALTSAPTGPTSVPGAITRAPTTLSPTELATDTPTLGTTPPPTIATATASPTNTTASPTVPEPPSSTPSAEPTTQPEVIFPEYTLAAFNNPASPQSKAFSWMLRDPNFGLYSPNRMRQRFALATLYYSTNGDDWSIQKSSTTSRQDGTDLSNRGGLLPWLSYAGHECDWYYQRTTPPEEGMGRQSSSILSQYSSNLLGVVVCENEFHSDGVFRAYRSLWLENVGLQGTLPPELAFLTGLEELQLTNNELIGSIPPQWFWNDKDTLITWQTTLQKLFLKNNTISGTVPPDIGLASNLERMDFQQNRIQLRIPTEIGRLSNLQHLLWNDNLLTGSIPTEIGRLKSMTACSWNNNQLAGSLPKEIGGCTSLQEFYVAENRLTGSIPWQLMFLRETLVDLHLYSNQLRADLPTRLGLLSKLRWFDVGDNRLTGEIPSHYGRMVSMQLFQVERNSLEGQVPSELGAWDMAARVWMQGNAELYGTIPYAFCPGGRLANGTTVESGRNAGSIDIRVDCSNGVTCPCEEGCSCERRRLVKETEKGGSLRG